MMDLIVRKNMLRVPPPVKIYSRETAMPYFTF